MTLGCKELKDPIKEFNTMQKKFFFSIAELKEKAVVDLLVSTLRSHWFPMILSLLYLFFIYFGHHERKVIKRDDRRSV